MTDPMSAIREWRDARAEAEAAWQAGLPDADLSVEERIEAELRYAAAYQRCQAAEAALLKIAEEEA